MTRLQLKAVLILAARVSLAANAPAQTVVKPPTQSAILGSLQDGNYKNDFLGFSLKVPKDWIVADQETTAAAAKIGTDTLKGKDQRDNKLVEESIRLSITLLNVTKKPVGASENAAFVLVVNKQSSSGYTPAMIAEATKSVLDSSPVLKLTADTRVKTVGGRNFALLDYEINANGQRANTKFYVTMIRDYSLSFSLSYVNDSDLVLLEKIVETMQFSGQ